MKKWMPWAITSVLVLLLGVSLVEDWVHQKHDRDNNQVLLDYSIGLAESNLIHADMFFSGNNPNHYDTTDVVNLISNAAGNLEAVSQPLKLNGIPHLYGVGVVLDDVARDLSHPNKYSSSEIASDKQMVHFAAEALKSAINRNGNVDVSLVPNAIQGLWSKLPSSFRADYNYW